MTRASRLSPEVRERAVRMVFEHAQAHASQWAAITSIAEKIGCAAETQAVLRRPVELAQYLSIRYTERLAEAGIERSVGSAGDSYDNALAETVIGLFKAEEIRRRTLEGDRGRGVCDARMGRLVQPQTPARAARLRSTGRVRAGLL